MSNLSLYALLARWAALPLPPPPLYSGPDVHFNRFVEDSRQVQPGDCFVARVRPYSDGHAYIPQALERGATLIVAQRPAAEVGQLPQTGAVYWQTPDSALTLSWLAAAQYDFPGRHLRVIGVTGTDGKTSTVTLIYEILRAAGRNAGMISTIRAVIGSYEEPLGLHVTTPQAPEVQAYLRRMVDDGVTDCVLETTSMGLAEHRVDAAFINLGVITNITHEHLDYHGDYDHYLAAKARLLSLASQAVILNRDDAAYARLQERPQPAGLTYGIEHPADVWADGLAFGPDFTRFSLHLPPAAGGEALAIATPLIGRFTIYNMLAAAAAAHSLGIGPSAIQRGLQAVQQISGRMERIHHGQQFLVVVDFAHTPNALVKAIEAARGMSAGRVITVFGSAGRRDVAKRRMMAEISAAQADLTILTAEDPRQEPLEEILAFMAEGCRAQGGVEGETFWRIADRGWAIYYALTLARPKDVVLVCGKGHEQSMCFGQIEHPWDDRQATTAALEAFLAGRPMPDLGLPTYTPNAPLG